MSREEQNRGVSSIETQIWAHSAEQYTVFNRKTWNRQMWLGKKRLEHALMDCERYEQDRRQMKENFRKEKVRFDLIDILQNNSNNCQQILFYFRKVTHMFGKI